MFLSEPNVIKMKKILIEIKKGYKANTFATNLVYIAN